LSKVKETVKDEKKLNPNVNFYSEQHHNNRLIRPRAEYKGNPDGMPWVPMPGRTSVLFGVPGPARARPI
jgi:hypothetical protein